MDAKPNVFIGEAPESDSEDELNVSDGVPIAPPLTSVQGKIVTGEAPESDDETVGRSGSLDSISSALSANSSTIGPDKSRSPRKNSSLLSKKLCEKNVSLAKNLNEFVGQTISNANNELNTVDHHLLKCQLNLQDASEILRNLTLNVNQLDAKIQSLLSSTYIPDIKIDKTESSPPKKIESQAT